MSATTELLHHVTLFRGISQEDLEPIATACQEGRFEAGANIVEIGEPGRSLYIITRGNVQVLYPARSADFELARLGRGEFFGEMALLNDKPRSATVRAVDAVDALVLDKAEFRRILMEKPRVALQLLEILSVRIRNADEHISGLSDQAMRDPLTGLLNRRAFHERMGEEIERTHRYGDHFSLILVDLDTFKSVNDTLGHDVGDQVLAWVGRILTEHTRSADAPFRVGGEEFAILCPATPSSVARSVAQRLVGVVGEAKPPVAHDVRVTMSAGYASCPEHGSSHEGLFNTADRALRTAKREGRDRVCDPARER